MNTLAEQQQALLQALFGPWDDRALRGVALQSDALRVRGLLAYRSNAQALAERSLAAAYPVLTQLIGQESIAALACDFWYQRPPQRGDIAQWGGELAAFIEAAPQLADEPYLSDVARVEWALHQAATAADRPADPVSFRLLAACDPAQITLVPAAGLALVNSAWPVACIVNAHQGSPAALQEAGRRLRTKVSECALVWRQGFKPMLREATRGELAFLEALHNGASLLHALERAATLDFTQWLGAAVRDALIVGAKPVQT